MYLNFYKSSEISIKSIQKMNNKTISDKRNMTYQHNPMQMVERRLNMIIAKKLKFD